MTYIKFKLKELDIFRPAEPSDITEGNIVFLIGDGNILYKMLIEEVIDPSSMFKAFCADDRCRYGLDDLYVLKTSNDLHKEVKELNDIIDSIKSILRNK
jgi:hypothetical protein